MGSSIIRYSSFEVGFFDGVLTSISMENHLILSGIYHPEHQKNNIENQAIVKMKKVNRNPNPSPENI